jgi:hypothetical protein
LAVRAERHRGYAVLGAGLKGGPIGWRVAGSHNRTVPLLAVLASSLPSGLKATSNTMFCALAAWRGAPIGWPVAGFHSRTVPLALALASRWPLGLNATADTKAPRPLRGLPRTRICLPVAGSHSRTVPSPSALASTWPLGLNATLNTPP